MNSSKDHERKDSILGMLVLLFLLLVFIFMTLSNKEDSKEEILTNVKTFMNGETFICSASALQSSMKYQVSISRGWQIQRDSFTKGDMLIEICACNKSLPMTKGGI
jgi:hypothetical protein